MSDEKQAGSDSVKKDVRGFLSQLETFFDEYLVQKAPFEIPGEGKEFIVKISPYLALIGAIMFLPALLTVLGVGVFTMPFAMMGAYGYGPMGGWSLALLAGLVVFVIEIAAIPGLFKRTKASWRLMYYAILASFLGNILSFDLVNGLIGLLIGAYILFQVKDRYLA